MKRIYALLLGVGLLALGAAWWYGLDQFLTIIERYGLVMSVFGWTGFLNYLFAIIISLPAGAICVWYAIREEEEDATDNR